MANYPRSLETSLQSEGSVEKVRLLFGARQTGKSTLLKRMTGERTRIFNLQERRTRLELERDPHVFTQILEVERERPPRRFRG